MAQRSAGGIASNQHRKVGVVAGSRRVSAVDPGAVSEIGNQFVRTKPRPLAAPKGAAVPMGIDLALNVGEGGPGTGRNVMDCGSQGRH
jgi:hypothetical protein